MKRIFVTGTAGFIGMHVSKRLLEKGYKVIGIDNINDYYDINLKLSRIEILKNFDNFTFIKEDIANNENLLNIFSIYEPDIVINLAAQAGVRYSIDYPQKYIDSNINGFYSILEACKKYPVQHLIYASSSSVYGNNSQFPFSENDDTSKPLNLYAATKKSNELMAYAYSSLFGIPTTGLRFFTVYGSGVAW
ncbi:NAD-dependent epimerase/dehydratase family protein, partial [Providencia sp. NPDC089923]|uniref:NAD-dependent epimerase/dehydratase family protein n=1 Tax=Providencia sp. NPDC089923 TaxID=3415004 RepID=UPI003C2FF154